MKYITILLLLFTLACENKSKKEESVSDTELSTKDMEVFIDEGSLITLGDTSEIWVKRVFPGGQTDQVSSIDSKGNNKVYEFDGIASLVLFDCKKRIYILDEIYYFLGDRPVMQIDNRIERLEDKNTWSKIEPGNYIEKVSQFVCKPEKE
jgi:hypothetical protein